MITDELHHLRAELLSLSGAITHADVIHQVRQTHDAEPDAARPVRGLRQLGHRGHIGIRFDDVVEEARCQHDALAQQFPVDGAIRSAVLVEVDRAETAVLVWAKPLLTARVCRFQWIQMRHRISAIGCIQE